MPLIKDERIEACLPGASIWGFCLPAEQRFSERPWSGTPLPAGGTATSHRIKAAHGEKAPLHVFPAMPVALAVDFGRIIMPKADMRLQIYDQNQSLGGFVPGCPAPNLGRKHPSGFVSETLTSEGPCPDQSRYVLGWHEYGWASWILWYETKPGEEAGTAWDQLAGASHRLHFVCQEMESGPSDAIIERALERLEYHMENYLVRFYELRERAVALAAALDGRAEVAQQLKSARHRDSALQALKERGAAFTGEVERLLGEAGC